MTGLGRLHWVGAALVALVLLGAATVIDGWLPTENEDPGSAPFVTSADLGERVELRTMSVRVDSVRGSRVLDNAGSELRSPGLWVLLEFTVVATDENTAVGFIELRDDADRMWSEGGRNSSTCLGGPPGVPAGCVAYFEVPPDALDSLRVRLARNGLDERSDDMAEVDLGLTDEDAAAFAIAPALEVPDTSLGAG